jgi:hypothetical protein
LRFGVAGSRYPLTELIMARMWRSWVPLCRLLQSRYVHALRTLNSELRDRSLRDAPAAGCRRPAERCDFEHSILYEAGGRTCPCNGNPACRHDHRAKQDPGWNAEQLAAGHLRWITPAGRLSATGEGDGEASCGAGWTAGDTVGRRRHLGKSRPPYPAGGPASTGTALRVRAGAGVSRRSRSGRRAGVRTGS